MKLVHFVITRFGLSGRQMFSRTAGPEVGRFGPYKSRTVNFRLKLLEMICLPGLLAQTNQDFTWVLLVDADLEEGVKERLREITRAKDRVLLYEYQPDAPDRLETLGWLAPLRSDPPDYVLTTINDDDDVLPRRFIDVVQSHALTLSAQGRLPPVKLMGARRSVMWNIVCTPNAPLGWAAPPPGTVSVTSSGFTLLCRYPAFDFSVLGMRHAYAETYFDFHAPPPVENVRFYRQAFLEAARDAAVGRTAMGDDAFFDVSRLAGTVLISNHGANNLSWRLRFWARVPADRRAALQKVSGAETFPDVSLDWDAVHRYRSIFSPWRTSLRLLDRKLYGARHHTVDRVRRFRDWTRALLRGSRKR